MDFARWKKNRELGEEVNLLVGGCRQTGKTTTISKFAHESYETVVLIDFSNPEHIRRFDEWTRETRELLTAEAYTDFFSRFKYDFKDSPSAIVFVDEIQCCPGFYNMLRSITHKMKSHLIAAGSNLRRLYDDPNVVKIAEEVEEIEMRGLSFPEFLGAFKLRGLYDSIDLYGNSQVSKYEELSAAFELYLKLGGYPAVLRNYILMRGFGGYDRRMNGILDVFLEEASQRFRNLEDKAMLKHGIACLTRLLLKETSGKSAVKQLSEYMLKSDGDFGFLNENDYNDSVKRIVSWLTDVNVIKGCGFVPGCDINSFKTITKFYFGDVGFACWQLGEIGAGLEDIGSLYKNFVFITLNDIIKTSERGKYLTDIPLHSTYDNGEIGFFLHNRAVNSAFAIDVNYGENASASKALADGKLDFVVKASGKGPFGIDGKIHAIPIYLLRRFNFDIASGKPVKYNKDLLKSQ
ncbi:MAG: AAA family ATPase [Clostridiales bacterium]|nr:AAA family ATPase [Clostridiales bacterium]